MHEHGHHDHDHHTFESPEQRDALLAYLIDHERSHADELHEMAHQIDGEAAALIHEAVELFVKGADKLEASLKVLKGE